MRKWLREPLLHFLVLGTALFAAYGVVNAARSSSQKHIFVTVGRIEHLATGFTRSWRRPPTAEELRNLISDYVREEVFYRQAKAIGLDHNDPVIRRRLQQKLEFLSEDLAVQAEPTDDDLTALLRTRPEQFRIGESFSFIHVYFNPERHPEIAKEAAAQVLAQLKPAGTASDISAHGDRFLLGSTFDALSAADVAKLFGADFARHLKTLPLGDWQGPISSGYGLHLVLLQDRREGRLPHLDEAREALRHEWKETQHNNANANAFKKMLSRYVVTIEDATTAGRGDAATAWVRK